jgi:Predicted membrane protein (DUF2157)
MDILNLAPNWHELSRASRFAVASIPLAICLGLVLRLGVKDFGGRVCLVGSMLMLAPILYVFDQNYPSGTTLFEFVRAWAFLTTPWAIILLAAIFRRTPNEPIHLALIALGLILIGGAISRSAFEKEHTIENGILIRFALKSSTQMQKFDEIRKRETPDKKDSVTVVHLNRDQVAIFVRTQNNLHNLSSNEYAFKSRFLNLTNPTQAYFAEYRLGHQGDLILIRFLDATLRNLG